MGRTIGVSLPTYPNALCIQNHPHRHTRIVSDQASGPLWPTESGTATMIWGAGRPRGC